MSTPSEPRRRSLATTSWVLVSLGLLGAFARPTLAQQPPTSVVVEPVRREEIRERRWITGELRPVRRAEVAAVEPGRVIELLVTEGQSLKRNDLIARLESQRLELDLKQVHAEEAVAQATVEVERAGEQQARNDLDSIRSLEQRSASRPKELSDAESALAIATARRLAAEAQLGVLAAQAAILDDRIEDAEIRAPFDGTVLSKLTEVGQWLAEGDRVVEILSDQDLEAWLAVPQQYVAAVMVEGITLPIRVEATRQTYTASELRLIPWVDSSVRNFALVAKLSVGDTPLLAGMSIAAAVPTGTEATHLTVNPDAILRSEIGPYLFVARSAGPSGPAQAMPATVEVLFTQGGRVAVRSAALREGDAVIIEGNEQLFPGMPVAPSEVPVNAAPKKADER